MKRERVLEGLYWKMFTLHDSYYYYVGETDCIGVVQQPPLVNDRSRDLV